LIELITHVSRSTRGTPEEWERADELRPFELSVLASASVPAR